MGNAPGKSSRFVAAVVGTQTMLERVTAFVGALTILALMILTTVGVVGRYVFNHPISGSYEVSGFLLVGIVFLAVAYVQSLRGHVRVELFGEQVFKQLSPRAMLILDIFGNVIGLLVFSIMTWQAGLLAWVAWDTKDYALGDLEILLWPPKTVFTLGVGLLCTRLILDIVNDFVKLKGMRDES